MINAHWMSDIKLAGLLFQEKLYSQGLFSDGEHENGFKIITTNEELILGIKNKNLWVKNIEEI